MIDLHIHSTISDGRDTPEQVVTKAASQGITALSLTDHDSVAGLAQASAVASDLSLTFLPGIEITTDYEETEVHLLGYCVDYTSKQLIKGCDEIHRQRRERAQEIIGNLVRLGYPLTWESFTGNDDFIGRSHIMDKLI